MNRLRAVLSGLAVIGVAAGALLWLGSRSATAVAQDAPTDHAAAQLVAERCGICHSTDLVTQQRLDRSRWTATVDKMIHWGAPLSPEERDILVNYLAAQYHPRRRPRRNRTMQNDVVVLQRRIGMRMWQKIVGGCAVLALALYSRSKDLGVGGIIVAS
ncbi:MAG: hypothetical protein ACREIJ_00160 [Nitrospiraceae bacterium]